QPTPGRKAPISCGTLVTANRQCRSFFRHSGLAQPGEIRGFVQRTDLRRPQPRARKGLQAGDARKKVSTVQPPGFGEFGGGAFGFASEGIGGGEGEMSERSARSGAARFFEPDDRLVDMRS